MLTRTLYGCPALDIVPTPSNHRLHHPTLSLLGRVTVTFQPCCSSTGISPIGAAQKKKNKPQKQQYIKEPARLLLNCLKKHKDPSTYFDLQSQLLISDYHNWWSYNQMQPLESNAFYCFHKLQWIWLSAVRTAVTDSISIWFHHASLHILLGPEEANR